MPETVETKKNRVVYKGGKQVTNEATANTALIARPTYSKGLWYYLTWFFPRSK